MTDAECNAGDPFGRKAHDKHNPDHSGTNGHYCSEWDGLWICQDCHEYECCSCFHEKSEEEVL